MELPRYLTLQIIFIRHAFKGSVNPEIVQNIARCNFLIITGMYTRRFSNHESRLLSRSHTFAIIAIFNRFENTSKYVDKLTLFSKNLNQRSLTPR